MRNLILASALILAGMACAGDQKTILVTTGTNYAATVTKYADPFTGDISEIAVYTAGGVTGAVSIVALDPFSGNTLVLATNVAATGFLVFTPRVLAADLGGSAALTVTNAATADRFQAQGERVFATVTGVSENSATNTFRVRIKVR